MLKLQRLNCKTHGFHTFSHFGSHTGTISPKTISCSLFLQKPIQDISLLRIFQLNHIVLHSHQSVQYMCACVHACVHTCVCVRVCVCMCIFCIIMHEHLLIYTFFFFLITFSILMYIMCVCLFSALSHRVGALQISIVIIIMCMTVAFTHTHIQACTSDYLTNYFSLLVEWQHKTTTAFSHGMHSWDDPHQTWKEPTDWKTCGCQKH